METTNFGAFGQSTGFENAGGFDQNAGFGGNFGGDATGNFGGATETTPLTKTRATYGDVPLTQIQGLQSGKYDNIEQAREAISSLTPEEIQRRKLNSENFQWVKTIVDKIVWDEKAAAEGKRKLKSPKFLGWLVILTETNGMERAMTETQLFAYMTAHCSRSGIIGKGETGLRLNHTVRKNKKHKSGGFTDTSVVSLSPLVTNLTKYAEHKLEAAKEPVYVDGQPVMMPRPGSPKGSTAAKDQIQKYDWKEEYREVFEVKKSSKDVKKAQASQDAYDVITYLYGLQESYM